MLKKKIKIKIVVVESIIISIFTVIDDYLYDVVIYCDVLFRLLHPTVLLEAFEHQQIKFDIDNTPAHSLATPLAVLLNVYATMRRLLRFGYTDFSQLRCHGSMSAFSTIKNLESPLGYCEQ